MQSTTIFYCDNNQSYSLSPALFTEVNAISNEISIATTADVHSSTITSDLSENQNHTIL